MWHIQCVPLYKTLYYCEFDFRMLITNTIVSKSCLTFKYRSHSFLTPSIVLHIIIAWLLKWAQIDLFFTYLCLHQFAVAFLLQFKWYRYIDQKTDTWSNFVKKKSKKFLYFLLSKKEIRKHLKLTFCKSYSSGLFQRNLRNVLNSARWKQHCRRWRLIRYWRDQRFRTLVERRYRIS